MQGFQPPPGQAPPQFAPPGQPLPLQQGAPAPLPQQFAPQGAPAPNPYAQQHPHPAEFNSPNYQGTGMPPGPFVPQGGYAPPALPPGPPPMQTAQYPQQTMTQQFAPAPQGGYGGPPPMQQAQQPQVQFGAMQPVQQQQFAPQANPYAMQPAQQQYMPQAAPAQLTPQQIAQLYATADAATPTYDTVYFSGGNGQNLEGDYVVKLVSWKAIAVNNPTPGAYNGLATVVKFEILESNQPGNPPGAIRGMFVKNDVYGPKTLRNLIVAMQGYDETRDAAAVAAFLVQYPLSQIQGAIAQDEANLAGFKERPIRLRMRNIQTKPKPDAPQGRTITRGVFGPMR